MIRLLADEHIPTALVHGLRQRVIGIDIKTVVQEGLRGKSDPELLEWAAANLRVLLTMDVQTLPGFASERLSAGENFAGLIVLHGGQTLRILLDDLEVLINCLTDEDCVGQVIHIPFN